MKVIEKERSILNEENLNLKNKINELKIDRKEKSDEIINLKKQIKKFEILLKDVENPKAKNLKMDKNKNKNELMKFNELEDKEEKIKNIEQKVMNLEKLVNSRNNYNIYNEDELQKLYWRLEEKEKEIERLKNQLIGYIEYYDLEEEQNLIAINFTSQDQKVNFQILCKANSLFSEVESKFYKKFPEYGKNDGDDYFFLGNGTKMQRFKTMSQNGFSGYAITIMNKNI